MSIVRSLSAPGLERMTSPTNRTSLHSTPTAVDADSPFASNQSEPVIREGMDDAGNSSPFAAAVLGYDFNRSGIGWLLCHIEFVVKLSRFSRMAAVFVSHRFGHQRSPASTRGCERQR